MSSILDDSQEKRKPGCRKNTNPRTQTSFVCYVAAPSEKNVLKTQGLVPGTAINKWMTRKALMLQISPAPCDKDS